MTALDDLSPAARHIVRQFPVYGPPGASVEAADWDTFAIVFGDGTSQNPPGFGTSDAQVIADAVAELVREEYCLLSRTPEGWLAITVLGTAARVR